MINTVNILQNWPVLPLSLADLLNSSSMVQIPFSLPSLKTLYRAEMILFTFLEDYKSRLHWLKCMCACRHAHTCMYVHIHTHGHTDTDTDSHRRHSRIPSNRSDKSLNPLVIFIFCTKSVVWKMEISMGKHWFYIQPHVDNTEAGISFVNSRLITADIQ